RDVLRVREEGFFRQHPRRAELRIVGSVEICPERTVAVGPQRAGEEQPILPGELLLAVHAERLVLLEGLEGVATRAAPHIAGARNRELEALRHLLLELLVVVLRPGG